MISASDVRRVIGEPYSSRGEEYFRRGKVQSVELSDENANILSTVSGSGRKLYYQDIEFRFTPQGVLNSVSGSCTCPVGLNCKHVAAAMFHLAHQLASANGAPEEPGAAGTAGETDAVSSGLRYWLEDISEAMRPRDGGPGAVNPEQRIYYAFRVDKDGSPEIVPCRHYPQDNGRVRNAIEYRNPRSIDYRWEFLTAEDAGIVAKLSHFSNVDGTRGFNWPKGDELLEFLGEIVKTGRARAENIRGRELAWGPPRRFGFEWIMDDRRDQRVRMRPEDGAELTLMPFPTLVYLDVSNGLIGAVETDLPPSLAGTMARAPAVPAVESGVLAAELARVGGKHVPMPRTVEVTRRMDIVPQPVLTLKGVTGRIPINLRPYFREAGNDWPSKLVYPCGQLGVAYEGAPGTMECRKGGGDLQVVTERGVTVIRRDAEREWRLLDQLEEVAEGYGGGSPEFFDFRIRNIPKAIRQADIIFPPAAAGSREVDESLVEFTAEAVPRMRERGWRVEIESTWPFRLREDPVRFGVSVETVDEDRFALSLKLEADGDEIDMAPIMLSVISSLPVNDSGELEDGFDVEEFLEDYTIYPKLKDGSVVRVDTGNLAPLVKAFLETHGLSELHRADAGRVSAFAEALEGSDAVWRGGKEIVELGGRLRSLAAASRETEPPAAMKGTLRPYQKLGYGWLLSLCETGFGGVLADDMGLGKTVQALALLAHLHLETGSDRPSLLIAPTSLVGNWMREAARFVPGLKVLPLRGPDRSERFCEIADHHLVITTYPLINRDHETLFSRDYELAILDEAQAVKNPATATARRIRSVNARQRIALTGTPIENNLEELWSLYDWLIPGFLGNRKTFNRHYRTPIEKRGDRARQVSLSRRVKPFLLRRDKEEVAKDLPLKTEIDEMIPLAETQRALYETIRVAMDERVREAVRARGIAGSRITILDALLKLRQVCCDPALVKLEAAREFKDSTKRKRLFELLGELVAEGRKVLVFSQFVEMLRLIERDVLDRGWNYAMLHGQTKKRDDEIAKFQEGEAHLFLISLKAGGVGLNLTAADTVILYDPWWNPAVERQAMDRAHRIGQEKPVFVYRLIAEGSVEASIVDMQARKRALADALFEGGGKGALSLTQDDIDALLMPIT